MNPLLTERRTAQALMEMISEWIINFKQLPESSAIYKAPLNISGRPLPGVELPEEYRHFQKEWITQDLLLQLLNELRKAAEEFGWCSEGFPLAFQHRGIRGPELIEELQDYKEGLNGLMVACAEREANEAAATREVEAAARRPWYQKLCRRVLAWIW